MKALLTVVLMGLFACGDDSDAGKPYTGDAQYICDTLLSCFGLDVPDCAATIESTTAPVNVSACAGCYERATCEAIGDLGTPGVCDTACNDALFGGPQ